MVALTGGCGIDGAENSELVDFATTTSVDGPYERYRQEARNQLIDPLSEADATRRATQICQPDPLGSIPIEGAEDRLIAEFFCPDLLSGG